MARIESRFAVAAWLLGCASGILRGVYAPDADDLGVLLWAILGLLLVAAAGGAGCLLGYGVAKLLRRTSSGSEEEQPFTGRTSLVGEDNIAGRSQSASGQEAELVGSLALGSAVGSFLGLVATLVIGAWSWAPYGAAGGAFALSCILTPYGDLVRVVLQMLARDEFRKKQDVSRRGKH